MLRAAGAAVDKERHEPHLYERADNGTLTEAILDLHVWWPGTTSVRLIDVSVRAATAARYTRAHDTPACASTAGESDKRIRYNGHALPLVFEVGGRLGKESQCTLRQLAEDASLAGLATPNIYNTWRCKLERVLSFSLAEAMLRALAWNAERYCIGGAYGAALPSRSSMAHSAPT